MMSRGAGKTALRAAFTMQAEACETLGSPFMARMFQILAKEESMKQQPQRLRSRMENWPGDPTFHGDVVALRLAGALHRIVLEGKDSNLGSVYPPPKEKEVDDAKILSAITGACAKHEDYVLNRLKSPPQTNEIRRCNALFPAFLRVSAMYAKPLMLLELGSAAGLNLAWDKYHYNYGGLEWGNSSSKVTLKPEIRGNNNPLCMSKMNDIDVKISGRFGCDLNPLQVLEGKDDDKKRLLSYIWPDQQDRLKNTNGAIEIAQQLPINLVKCGAEKWLEQKLVKEAAETKGDKSGSATVIYNTIAWQYFPADVQKSARATILNAMQNAEPSAPVIWIEMEADKEKPWANITMTVSHEASYDILNHENQKSEVDELQGKLAVNIKPYTAVTLGRVDFHGRWIDWNPLM
eukprot:jgi/Bigna1/89606/estExt_fgenesh1_pg.C_520078